MALICTSSSPPVASLRYRAMNGTVAPSASNRTTAPTDDLGNDSSSLSAGTGSYALAAARALALPSVLVGSRGSAAGSGGSIVIGPLGLGCPRPRVET